MKLKFGHVPATNSSLPYTNSASARTPPPLDREEGADNNVEEKGWWSYTGQREGVTGLEEGEKSRRPHGREESAGLEKEENGVAGCEEKEEGALATMKKRKG